MAKFVHNNSAIECLSAEITSRKIQNSSYIKLAKIGRCFVYKCSRNSSAKIVKELSPKLPNYCNESNLNANDLLECDSLFVAIKKETPYVPDVINLTGRHKAQMFISKEYTFAKITKQIFNIPEKSPENTLTIMSSSEE